MPANAEEVWKIKATASNVSLAVGFIFPISFFALNDPDGVKFSVALIWLLIFLIPASLVIAFKYGGKLFLNAIAILAGIFIGTCVAMIVMGRASLFPIVAVIWTIVAVIPVAVGSIIGFLTRKLYKQ